MKIVPDFNLSQLVLNVTNDCNCACTYCFTHKNPKIMTLQVAKDAIEWGLKQANGQSTKFTDGVLGPQQLFVNWFGGEPLLRFNEVIKPTMEWAREKGYNIGWGISTNCTLLTPVMLEFFREYKTGMLYSLDGIEEVQSDQRPLISGKSSYDLVKDKFKMLSRYPYSYVYRTTIAARNVDKLYEGYLFARKNGFKNYYCGFDYGDKDWNQEYFDSFTEQIFAMCNTMYEDAKAGYTPTLILPFLDAVEDIAMGKQKEFILGRCGLGTSTIGVSPEGLLYGCQEHATYEDKNDKFYLGDIYNGIIQERQDALLSEYYEGYEKNKINEKCKNCEFIGSCYMKNCPSSTFRIAGKFGEPVESFCQCKIAWDSVARIILARCALEKCDNFKHLLEKNLLHREVK